MQEIRNRNNLYSARVLRQLFFSLWVITRTEGKKTNKNNQMLRDHTSNYSGIETARMPVVESRRKVGRQLFETWAGNNQNSQGNCKWARDAFSIDCQPLCHGRIGVRWIASSNPLFFFFQLKNHLHDSPVWRNGGNLHSFLAMTFHSLSPTAYVLFLSLSLLGWRIDR